MEYVSVLAGERFSDRPRCTRPALAWLGQRVNDAVSDAARDELILRAPLLALPCPQDPTERILASVTLAALAAGADERRVHGAARRRVPGGAARFRLGTRLRLLEAFLAFDACLAEQPVPARDRHLVALLDTVLDALHPVGRATRATARELA